MDHAPVSGSRSLAEPLGPACGWLATWTCALGVLTLLRVAEAGVLLVLTELFRA
jgi:hypothetical protein